MDESMRGRPRFYDLLSARWDKGAFVCIGLDSELSKIPPAAEVWQDGQLNITNTLATFNLSIARATQSVACAFKLNSAFYEAHGAAGMAALEWSIETIKEAAPDVPIILDAKRADIGNTNNGYVRMAFEQFDADAITVHPYLGAEALQPFLDRADKGVIVLCRTSNAGAGEFQDLLVDGEPLYIRVARRVAQWNGNRNCAVVVGATYPTELARVRSIIGSMPILIPGVGAQGGDVAATVEAGQDGRGRGMIINASRSIIFASSGEDYDEAAARAAGRLSEEIMRARLMSLRSR